MANVIYFDELVQSFAASGNVFLKLGVISGDVDANGQDIKSEAITLVIPLEQLGLFSKNVQLAAETYVATGKVAEIDVESIKNHQMGIPLIIPR